jgi:3-isopropylmalate dehydratase small subunit
VTSIESIGGGGLRASITGRAWCFGDDISTDVIHPPDFYSLKKDKVKAGLFHKLDPTMQERIQPGDVLVAGRNFGCGSSRETSVLSLVHNGIGAIVARSFGRIFFRNATNRGLPCLVLRESESPQGIETGDSVIVSLEAWTLRSERGATLALEPASHFIRRIWDAGGLLGLLDA